MSSFKLPTPVRDQVAIEIPLPPSVNNLFRSTGNKRFKTREYRDWIEKTQDIFARLVVQTEFPCEIEVVVKGKVNQARDLDNALKPIGDALVNSGVLPGDNLKHVCRWDVRYEPDEGEPRVEVIVWPPENE